MPVKSGKKFGKIAKKASMPEFSVATSGKIHHISPKEMQRLKVMGCSPEYVKDVLHAVNVLDNYSGREIDPSIFEGIKRRYHLGMGTMTSIVAMSNLKLSDRGVDLRGIARFYSRNRAEIGDVDRLERFVNWIKARGEPVTGMPAAWKHFSSLNKKSRRTVRKSSRTVRKSTRKSIKRKPARAAKKTNKKKTSSKSKKSKRSKSRRK
jgi:hypothetical protein